MPMSLQELSDRQEIQDLMVAYCYAIDRKNWDELDEVFTPDAVIDYTEMVGFRGNLAETKAFLVEGLAPAQSLSAFHFHQPDSHRGRYRPRSHAVLQPDGHRGQRRRSKPCSWVCGIAISSCAPRRVGAFVSATRSAATRITFRPDCCPNERARSYRRRSNLPAAPTSLISSCSRPSFAPDIRR